MDGLCSSCKLRPRRSNGMQRLCLICHAADTRHRRKQGKERPSLEAMRRVEARIEAKRAVRRGMVGGKPAECERCGERKPLEMHHPDYSMPTLIAWLCHHCHLSVEGRTAWV